MQLSVPVHGCIDRRRRLNMSRTVTVEELISRITGVRQEKVHNPCTESHLWNIAKKLSQWRHAAPLLGFEQADVDAWEYDARHDEEGKRHLMLTKWRQKNGSRATYKALAEVLLKVDRTDLAESLLMTMKDASTETIGSPHVFSSPPLPHSHQSTRRHFTLNYSHHSPFRQGISLSSPCATVPQPFSTSSTPFYAACNGDTVGPYAAHSPYPLVSPDERQYKNWDRGLRLLQPVRDHVAIPIQQEAPATSTFSATQGSTGHYHKSHFAQRFEVVYEQGGMAVLLSENIRLRNRVQQLELELENTKNRDKREINYLKEKLEFERRDNQCMVQLLQQQLANARYFQSCVGRSDAKLCQKGAHLHTYEGRDCIDGAPDVDENAQRQQRYHAHGNKVYDLGEATLCVSYGELSDQCVTYHATCVKHEMFEMLHRFQGLSENKRKKRILSLEERRKEMAMNTFHFLEANDRTSEVVSHSLEYTQWGHWGMI